ncbi:MAG: FAD-dependent monooxygenase [Rhodoferax sp.]
MEKQILIVGGGIGGMAAALGCLRSGWPVQLLERTREFREVGAGIQLGPNVVRILHDWGMEADLNRIAAYPELLRVCNATNCAELGVLRLGERARSRYGAPYATVHRADLHRLLHDAVLRNSDARIHMGQWLGTYVDTGLGVQISSLDGTNLQGSALIGADGIWSTVRQLMLKDEEPRVTGHLAFRGLVSQHDLPAYLRSRQVTVWLGEKLHVVQYPVRKGHWLNVVAIVEGAIEGDVQDWNHDAVGAELQRAMGSTCNRLQDLISAVPDWKRWVLCDRPPMTDATQQAQGRVALVGDAAHPMRPYMAQGAGMALEDAAYLESVLKLPGDLPMGQRLLRYAKTRWRRNAQVQARSQRNGEIFHATGAKRWGRDMAMALLGERVLDVPWLYRGGPI